MFIQVIQVCPHIFAHIAANIYISYHAFCLHLVTDKIFCKTQEKKINGHFLSSSLQTLALGFICLQLVISKWDHTIWVPAHLIG